MAVAYSYNQVGELTTVTPSGTGNVPPVTYAYDPSGRVSTVTRGGSTPVTTTAVFDGAGQLSSLQHSTTAGVAQGYAITRDTRGNPTRVDTTTATGTTTALYTYDAVSRLRSECYPVSGEVCVAKSPRNAYTYDKVGNRASETSRTVVGTKATTVTTDYTYDAAYQLLTQSVAGTPTVTNTWSANGALATSTTPAGTQTYTTDLTDELISLELEDSSIVGYTHDASGNRTSRTVDGLLDASWAWDDLSSLPMRIGEYEASGSLATAWLVDPTSSTGASLAQTSGGASSWLLNDPFANTVASVSTTGSTVSGTRTMDAFGVERTSATGSLADAAVGFAGQYLDDATGLYDMRARDYDPTSGRFTATDPVAVPTGMPFVAGYSYAFNNPLMLSDVTGNWPSWSDYKATYSGMFAAARDAALNMYVVSVPSNSVWVAQQRADIVRSFMLGVEENGYWTQINESFNPVLQTIQSADATITAYKEGDYYGVGYNGVNTDIAILNTCAIAYGGAKALGPKITPRVLPTESQIFRNLAPEDVVRPNGFQPIDPASLRNASGRYNYVVDTEGRLVLGNYRYGHIDLANGGGVLAAGEVRVVNGEVISINNASGHYRPSGPTAQVAAEDAFASSGLPVRPGAYGEVRP